MKKNSLIDLGVMIDCSRNAVFTVEKLKQLLWYVAEFGMKQFFLYLEDLYELPDYPYFGYRRGRYSSQELKEIDLYAEGLGIEVIPCIQTLGHLKSALRWGWAKELKDTEDILLVGSEEVYLLIRRMIEFFASVFRSRTIHLGMDEAYALGLGRYLKEHGYRESLHLLEEHLDRVVGICRELQMKPMVWSDMFLRPFSKAGDYYQIDESKAAQTTAEDRRKPPDDLRLVYWDYYHDSPDFYRRFIRIHKSLSLNPAFAGGAWTWNGIAPNYRLAFKTTDAAVEACLSEEVNTIFCTVWFDDGAETPVETALPVMAYFAERVGLIEESAAQLLRRTTGIDWETIQLLGEFDALPQSSYADSIDANPSKWLLYQDPLLGLFDSYLERYDFTNHYRKLQQQLEQAEESLCFCSTSRFTDWQIPLFRYYRKLAGVLSMKADFGVRMRKAYRDGQLEVLKAAAEEDIPQLQKAVAELREYRKKVWFNSAKSFGFEIIDSRYGALQQRLQSAGERLSEYLRGELEAIEELDEQLLPFWNEPSDGKLILGKSCNEWQKIISASPL